MPKFPSGANNKIKTPCLIPYRPQAEGEAMADNTVPSKRDERIAFILLAVLLAPALSVAIVGGYGFIIWMSQLVLGPPTG